MVQSISASETKATSTAVNLLEAALESVHATLLGAVALTLSDEATPTSFAAFEEQLTVMLRELGRNIVEQTVNRMEVNAMQICAPNHFE